MRRSSAAISSTPFTRSASSSAGRVCSRRSISASWAVAVAVVSRAASRPPRICWRAAGEMLGQGRPQQIDEAADEDGEIEEAGDGGPDALAVGGLGVVAGTRGAVRAGGRRAVRRRLAVSGVGRRAGCDRRQRGRAMRRAARLAPVPRLAAGCARPAGRRPVAPRDRRRAAPSAGPAPEQAGAPRDAWTDARRGARLGVLDGHAAERDQGRNHGRGTMPRPLEESFTKSE